MRSISGGSASDAAVSSAYADSIAQSMTIDEMRQLHERAVRDAAAKTTELRLVLASRYRELMGSSDEVIKMNERSQELHKLVKALPELLETLTAVSGSALNGIEGDAEEKKELSEEEELLQKRRDLVQLPRIVYRALDVDDVYKAATTLIDIFTLISSLTSDYQLAHQLAHPGSTKATSLPSSQLDSTLRVQVRMIFLQLQSLPQRIVQLSSQSLMQASSWDNAEYGAYRSASALVAWGMLDRSPKASNTSSHLLDLYFDSKAQLLVSLLNQLQPPKADGEDGVVSAGPAEEILSKIVLILQYDAILHPYQIFCRRSLPFSDEVTAQNVANHLPTFDALHVRAKCSKFLASHIPLIRTKVKTVLVTIAGTTASALGSIRQSLYDHTDGAQIMERLNEGGLWDEAVEALVDQRTVLNTSDLRQRFSFWNALFSHTFSSLVHSLLTASFSSVHTSVVSTLRASLAHAPPAADILPHEAHRNTLHIATSLDKSLRQVSDDAHELLVHAEERVESEKRLRESLYVHSCEILGRLVCELRRMVTTKNDDESMDAATELIVGRLCFLLKSKLASLPTLLDPMSSPASMQSTSGMISYIDLQSAFELCDDKGDGLVSFEEALQAADSAFSGTQFHGAEMVRETLLLSSEDSPPQDVTLAELVLLAARGLKHELKGVQSALGAFQLSLDRIVDLCFEKFTKDALKPSKEALRTSVKEFVDQGKEISAEEWSRLYTGAEGQVRGNVSPHLPSFVLSAASVFSRHICPSDGLASVPSEQNPGRQHDSEGNATLVETMRSLVLRSTASALYSSYIKGLNRDSVKAMSSPCLIQLLFDMKFVDYCFSAKFTSGDSSAGTRNIQEIQKKFSDVYARVESAATKKCGKGTIQTMEAKFTDGRSRLLESSGLFFSGLMVESSLPQSASTAPTVDMTSSAEPFFHTPLASPHRFTLLPVPTDRSLSELHRKGRLAKEKQDAESSRPESAGGNVVSSGLGFLSSMLKNRS